MLVVNIACIMKKVKVALFIAFLFISFFSFGQTDTVRLRNISAKTPIVTDRPPQAVYFQVLGSGPILSVKYDRRFGNRVNGLGFAAGIGFWSESEIAIVSFPLQLNYLFGRKDHFIELAGGTTYVTSGESLFDEDESGFIQHINIGYRHQPTRGGFFFRGGFSPLFFSGESFTSFYLGFGHNF
jgi:hypothetical protein